jgi:hypothetical protein
MRITNAGSVGIGTTSPNELLTLYKSTAAQTATQYGNSNTGDGSGNGFVVGVESLGNGLVWQRENTYIRFGTNATERMRIDSSGNVGIGESSPVAKVHIQGSGTSGQVTSSLILENSSSGTAGLQITGTAGSSHLDFMYGGGPSTGTNTLTTGMSMTLEGSGAGNVGIGTTSPSRLLTLSGTASPYIALASNTTGGSPAIFFGDSEDDNEGRITYSNAQDYMSFSTATLERIRIDSAGGVGIDTSSIQSGVNFQIGSNDGDVPSMALRHTTVPMYLANGFNGSQGVASISLNSKMTSDGSDTYDATRQNANYPIVAWETGTSFIKARYGTGATLVDKFTIATGTGNTTIAGSLSKGSGSFKIDHPLPAKTDTHHLIHSFIEGPQADNIYRGKVDLVNGSATVNIDTVAGMTEGTFVALNREVQCFTTNESNWDAVKGSVSGNILTIESQNSESTATISWLVIGERQDQHMYDTDWTDENGKVIVEPLKTNEE